MRGADCQRFHRIAQNLMEIEFGLVEIKLTRFDLGKIKNIVDQTQ